MSDDAPDGWTTPSQHGNSLVYHTSRDCPCFPSEEYVRRLAPNEIVSRDLRQCSVCEGQDGGWHGGTRTRECPWCGESVHLRSHLPCPDESGDADE